VKLGWRVFAGQYMPEWPQLARLAEQYPDTLHLIPLDVRSETSVQLAVQTVGEIVTHMDVLINNAGISAGRSELGGLEYGKMLKAYDVNALGPIRVVHAFLPLMTQGMRRLCFVSSEAGSISLAYRTRGFGYCMSKSALNMAVRIMYNDLYPDGYTFRLYHPGWVRSYMSGTKGTHADLEPEEAGAAAIPYFLNKRDDEGRLVLMDYQGLEWPF
jgi:NAD(P)-dependent dehydrogenase (short-subunit alcohol dehydrogenase family)